MCCDIVIHANPVSCANEYLHYPELLNFFRIQTVFESLDRDLVLQFGCHRIIQATGFSIAKLLSIYQMAISDANEIGKNF